MVETLGTYPHHWVSKSSLSISRRACSRLRSAKTLVRPILDGTSGTFIRSTGHTTGSGRASASIILRSTSSPDASGYALAVNAAILHSVRFRSLHGPALTEMDSPHVRDRRDLITEPVASCPRAIPLSSRHGNRLGIDVGISWEHGNRTGFSRAPDPGGCASSHRLAGVDEAAHHLSQLGGGGRGEHRLPGRKRIMHRLQVPHDSEPEAGPRRAVGPIPIGFSA